MAVFEHVAGVERAVIVVARGERRPDAVAPAAAERWRACRFWFEERSRLPSIIPARL